MEIDPTTLILQPKQAARHSDAKIARLVESLKVHGMLQLPVVTRDRKVIVGAGRTIAWMKAFPGKPMPVRVVEGGNLLAMTGAENLVRSDYTMPQITELVADMIESGMTQKDIAGAGLDLDATQVSRHHSITTRCIPLVLEAYRSGRIDYAVALEIYPADPSLQPALLADALNGATKEQIARKRKPPSTQEKVKKLRLVLGGVTLTFSGSEVSLDTSIEGAAEAIREMKKARDQGISPKTLEKSLAERNR